MQLDSRPGPAVPLDERAADALIESVLDQWLGGQRLPSPSPWLMAAAVTLCAALPLSAAAVWMAYEAAPPAPSIEVGPVAAVGSAPVDAPTPAPAELEFETEEIEAIARRRPARRPVPATADLLARANRLRSARRWPAAAQAYARVIRRAPASREAYVASIAQADILLEHLGRRDKAAQLYRRALSQLPGGPLEIEAQNGLRRCLQ